MPSQGPFVVGTGVNVAGANADWSSPVAIEADDDTSAFASPSAAATTDYLSGTDAGFVLPAGATVDGIEVSLNDMGGSGSLATLYLTKDGSTPVGVGIGVIDFTDWFIYGSSTYLWGATWTAEEINATTFGALLVCGDDSIPVSPQVDAMSLTVYYTDAGGQPSAMYRYCRGIGPF